VHGMTDLAPSRRERVRAATLAEIKTAALELMREQGSTQIHFSDIARTMGMTAPALYRYFADRDALLTVLIIDAYNALADELEARVADVAESDDWERLKVTMQVYRAWALAQPERFALIFGLPVPGFTVDEDAGTKEAAKRAMGLLQSIVVKAYEGERLEPSVVTRVSPALAASFAEQHGTQSMTALPAGAHQGVLQAWVGMHGFVSLEAFGHLDWFPQEARDGLFEAQAELVARAIGIAVPPD
jgi:AcrR family transcriptional regulator